MLPPRRRGRADPRAPQRRRAWRAPRSRSSSARRCAATGAARDRRSAGRARTERPGGRVAGSARRDSSSRSARAPPSGDGGGSRPAAAHGPCARREVPARSARPTREEYVQQPAFGVAPGLRLDWSLDQAARTAAAPGGDFERRFAETPFARDSGARPATAPWLCLRSGDRGLPHHAAAPGGGAQRGGTPCRAAGGSRAAAHAGSRGTGHARPRDPARHPLCHDGELPEHAALHAAARLSATPGRRGVAARAPRIAAPGLRAPDPRRLPPVVGDQGFLGGDTAGAARVRRRSERGLPPQPRLCGRSHAVRGEDRRGRADAGALRRDVRAVVSQLHRRHRAPARACATCCGSRWKRQVSR